jgi:hypothetical protein
VDEERALLVAVVVAVRLQKYKRKNEKKRRKKKETFDVEEVTPTSYVHMGNPVFRQPMNPNWRAKVSYKGKTDLVKKKRKENLRLVEKEAGLDYRFHTAFQQNFYESMIIPKNKPIALS